MMRNRRRIRSGSSGWVAALIFAAAFAASMILHHRTLRLQHEEDMLTLGQKWNEGHDQALGKPASEEWLRSHGFYRVKKMFSDPCQGITNTYYLMQFLGSVPNASAGEAGTNMLFILQQKLDEEATYFVERKRDGVRYKKIKPPKA